MAQARLEALDVDLRRLLRAASVFEGGPSGGRGIEGARRWAGRGSIAWMEARARRGSWRLVRRAKLCSERARLAFRRALVREAAAARVSTGGGPRARPAGLSRPTGWSVLARTDAMTLAEHHERGWRQPRGGLPGLPSAPPWALDRRQRLRGGAHARRPRHRVRPERGGPGAARSVAGRGPSSRRGGGLRFAYARAQEAMRPGSAEPAPLVFGAGPARRSKSASSLGEARRPACAKLAAAPWTPRSIRGPVFTEGLVAAASVAAELVVVDVDEAAQAASSPVALVGSDDPDGGSGRTASTARTRRARAMCRRARRVRRLRRVGEWDAFHRIGDACRGYLHARW